MLGGVEEEAAIDVYGRRQCYESRMELFFRVLSSRAGYMSRTQLYIGSGMGGVLLEQAMEESFPINEVAVAEQPGGDEAAWHGQLAA